MWVLGTDNVMEYNDSWSVFEDAISRLDTPIPKDAGELIAYECLPVPIDKVDLEKKLSNFCSEYLDQKYGSPAVDVKPLPVSVKHAMWEYVDRIAMEYMPFRSTFTGKTEKIDIYEWCLEHRPEWIEEG
jgi:hypothetical protein